MEGASLAVSPPLSKSSASRSEDEAEGERLTRLGETCSVEETLFGDVVVG